jgi:hypothetical protein
MDMDEPIRFSSLTLEHEHNNNNNNNIIITTLIIIIIIIMFAVASNKIIPTLLVLGFGRVGD